MSMPIRGEYRVDGGGGRRVAVADHVCESVPTVLKIGGQAAGNLGNPVPGRARADCEQMHAPGLDLDDEGNVQPGQRHGV